MTANTVCPLGLCRFEEDCPNAPCVDCMRRLGEHMIEEVRLMERQATIAKSKGDASAFDQLDALLASMSFVMPTTSPALANVSPDNQEFT